LVVGRYITTQVRQTLGVPQDAREPLTPHVFRVPPIHRNLLGHFQRAAPCLAVTVGPVYGRIWPLLAGFGRIWQDFP
jgi:hypothetical protein